MAESRTLCRLGGCTVLLQIQEREQERAYGVAESRTRCDVTCHGCKQWANSCVTVKEYMI